MTPYTPYNEKTSSGEFPFNDSIESEKYRKMHLHLRRMEHDLFFLYVFLTSEGICDEACEYLQNHSEDPIPFHSIF